MTETLRGGPRWKARPTVYRGIHMRSRLEAKAAAWLDLIGRPWRYEPVCFADEHGEYLPDFHWPLANGRSRYWEVKGWAPDAGKVQRRMQIILVSEPDAVLVLDILSGDPGGWFYEPRTPEAGWQRLPITPALW